MASLPTAKEITELAMLLAPGLLILGIRGRFKEGAVPDLKSRALGYAIASVAYYAAIGPLFHVDGQWAPALPPWLWGLLHYVVVPSLLAVAIVIFDQREWFYKVTGWARLRLAHHIPAAWDYAFSRLDHGTFVWVKLTSGTEYAGKMGAQSFASSSATERDLYLEEVWQINEGDQPWTLMQPPRGVLLCGRDIQRIEIFGG